MWGTAVHLSAKVPFQTSMGQRPMWGIAPRPGHNTSPSANGATHPFTAWGRPWRMWVARDYGTGLRPSCGVGIPFWGVAPGWYEAAPLALATAVHLRAKGPVYLGGPAQTAGAGILLT